MHDQEKTKEQLLIELNTLKEENRKLKKSRQHYQKDELKNQAVLNALPDILFHLDKNGIFLDYHAPKNDLLYSRPENFINEKITDILPKNIAVKTIDLTKEVLYTGKIMSFEYELPISNELRYFEARFTVFDENSVLILTRDITEKKALDKAHIESLEKFKSLTDNLNVGVYRTTAGAKGKFIEVNPAFLKMFGFDNKDEILSLNVSDLYMNPNDREELNQIMLEQGFVKNRELSLCKKDGAMIIASISTVAVKDENGNVKYFDGIIEEITERKRAEQDLKESEEKFRILAENIPGVIYLSLNDEMKTLVYLNDEVKKLTGYSKEEFMRNDITFSDLYHPDDKADIHSVKDNSLKQKRAFHLIYRIKDKYGKQHWIEEYGIGVLRENNAILLEGFMIDITSRKKVEMALIENEEKFRELFNNMSSGVAVYEAHDNGNDFVFKDINKTSEMIEKVSRNEIIGKSVLDVFPSIKEFGLFEVFQKVWKTGNPEHHPVSFYQDEKIAGWRENYVYKLPSGEIVAVYDDITRRKQAEEQVKKNLEEKEVLLQEIHHRVKNNMQVVSSLLRMQSRYFKDEFDKKLILDSRNRVNSMALIHESLYQSKDLSQIDFEYYIKNLIGHLISTFGSKAEHIKYKQNINKIFLNINKAIPCGLIVNELISNSIKYAFPDGKEGEISINMELKDNEYTLFVFDNGVGLPEEVDFLKPESLGLQLISALTKQLHGTVDLERKNGTYYTIRFKKEFTG